MDLAVRFGLLAIAADTQSSEAQSSGLVSQQSGSKHHAHTFSGAAFGVGILLELGTPAATPRPAGKGLGKPKNYCPAPRTRYPVIFKSKKAFKSLVASP